MRRDRRGASAAAWGMLLAGVVLAVACGGLFTTRIADIKGASAKYDGEKVTIAGEVTGSVNLFVVKFYKVSDGTGEIAVVTQSPLPKDGDKVRVRGKVQQAFAIGPDRMLVLVEEPPSR
ncbi:MAG: hypothetical protein ACHQQS_16040 [Thermoanaerobaculales bacterium]